MARSDGRKDYWFGLHKVKTWQWTDGNESTYRKWASDEPDSGEECVLYADGAFMSSRCNVDHLYICKKDAGIAYFFRRKLTKKAIPDKGRNPHIGELGGN